MIFENDLSRNIGIRFFKKHQDAIVLGLIGIVSFIFIYAGLETDRSKLLAIPFLAMVFFLILFFPNLLLYCFITCFFLQKTFFQYEMIFFNYEDILVFGLLGGFLSWYFSPQKISARSRAMHSGLKVPIFVKFLVLFLVSSTISCAVYYLLFSNLDIARSLSYLFHLSELPVVFLILFNFLSYKQRNPSIALILILSTIELLIVGVQFVFSAQRDMFSLQKNVVGTFDHHCQIGNMLTISIACSLYKFIKVPSLKSKVFYLLLSFLFVWAITASSSRSNLNGVFIAVVLAILTQFKFNLRYVVILTGICVICFVLFVFSPMQQIIQGTLNNSQGTSVDISAYQRFFIWQGAWEHFVQAPIIVKLLGIGIGNYPNLVYKHSLLGGYSISGAHNNFLHVLSETGIIGFICFVCIFTSILVILWKKGREDVFAYLYFWATIALILSGLTQETFWFQNVFGNLWLYYMFGLALTLIDNKEPSNDS